MKERKAKNTLSVRHDLAKENAVYKISCAVYFFVKRVFVTRSHFSENDGCEILKDAAFRTIIFLQTSVPPKAGVATGFSLTMSMGSPPRILLEKREWINLPFK